MRTQALLDRLVDELSRNCGDVLAAARACGVSLKFVSQWRKDDKITDDALLEAERMGTQGLVSAAIQRAVHGVEEDVYFKGEVVGQKTNYSDSLLATLLKAKVDDFKPSNESGPPVTVNIANIMPRASSYEEWLAMRDMTNAPKAIAAPVQEAIDVQFETVQDTVFAGISL